MTNPRNDFNTTTALSAAGATAGANATVASASNLGGLCALIAVDPKASFWFVTPIMLLVLHLPIINLVFSPFLLIAICVGIWMARGLVMGSVFVVISVIATFPYLRYGLLHWGMEDSEGDAALMTSLIYMTAYHFWLRYIFLNNAAYEKIIARIRSQTGKSFATEIGVRGLGGKSLIVRYDEPSKTLAFVANRTELIVPLTSLSWVSWIDSENYHDHLVFYGVGPDNQTLRTRVRGGAESLANRLEGHRMAATA